MKRLLVIAGLISACLISNTSRGPACLGQEIPLKETGAASGLAAKSTQVDGLLSPFNQPQTPGVAILVIQDGRIVHHKGYGLARLDTKEPIGPDTAFDLASMSKQFTAMAVMILAERGKLNYDDALSKFFPDFPNAQKVTIRNLLTHTSGLVDVISAKWFRQGYEPTSREVAKLFTQEPKLKAGPGERFEYNNAGYVLLALIVEKVSGQSFPTFMQQKIFKPLGMNHSLIWDETRPKIEHLALSYAPVDNSFKSIAFASDNFLYGPKGVITTTEDLSKWNEALDSEKLVKTATLRLAFAPMKLNDGSESPYGFGWGIAKDNGLLIIEHPGGYLGYRTDIRRYPGQRTTIIVLSNNAQVDGAALAKSIGHIYLSDKMVAPAAKVKLDPGILAGYVGNYEGDSTAMPNLIIEISFENGELYITSPLRPKSKLLAQSATEFIVGETSATATFTKDEKGNVVGLALKTRMGVINARRRPKPSP